MLSFSQTDKNNSVCNDFSININTESGNYFVTKKRVLNILKSMGYSSGKNTHGKLNIKRIEKKLNGLSSVKSATVYKNINGNLSIDIIQRKPIARIFNANGNSLYIDENGKTMPVSEYYTARVVPVSGNLNLKLNQSVEQLNANDSLKNSSLLDEVYNLTSYIENNKFLKSQIEQIYIEKNNEIILIPKVGNQQIIFGKIVNIEEKMDKLILFYTKGINPQNLNLYKTINLKYSNQIVCKKNI